MALSTQLTEEQQEAINTLASAPAYANESKLSIFRQLPWSKKLEYFREHFLIPAAAAAIIIALVTFLAVRFISPDARPALTKLQTMLSSKQIDVIIAPHKIFKQLAGYGYLTNLESTVSKSDNTKLDDATVQLKGFSDADDDGIDSSGTGKGASKSYGLKLSDATGWTSIADSDHSALIGIATGTKNTGTAQRFIDWLYR